ncbi:hypothetical protein [Candidatus Poriferisodalis sp.]|uniref:hypothetical protein n=1 Tax=Candidatus Poriferisodalis sp. TaxID=3101277 RepID=UPI003B51E66F
MSTTITVAPREIHDLAYRAGCVAGCDAGTAERIAHNVTFSEIHHGAAVRAFCEALETHALPASSWVAAPDALAAAELAARNDDITSTTFEPGVPLAAIAGTLQQSLERGVAPTRFDADARGDTSVATIELCLVDDEAVSARRALIADAHNEAYRHGLAVERIWFSRLEAAAATYLVAESTLDEIDSRSCVA